MRLRIADTVEHAIPSTSAISGPVRRTRRNAAIATTRSSDVCQGQLDGADERSTRPAIRSITRHPLASGADADFSGLGRRSQRPFLLDNATAQSPTSIQAERSVSVQLHPVPSLGAGCVAAPASKEARMNNVLRNYI